MIEPPKKPAPSPPPATSTDRDAKAEPKKPEDDKRIERFPER